MTYIILAILLFISLPFVITAIALVRAGVSVGLVLKWLVRIPLMVIVVLLGKALASYMVKNHSTDDKRYLTGWWWRIWGTIDNDLGGDSYWKKDHLNGDDPLKDENRIGWIKRNAGNGFNYNYIGVPNDAELVARYRNEAGIISGGPLWQNEYAFLYRNRTPVGFGRELEVFLGWALFGEHFGRCKIVMSVRLPKAGTGI